MMNKKEETTEEALEALIKDGLVEAYWHNDDIWYRLTPLGEQVADQMGLIPEDLTANLH
jgi:DNA-binding PadR family transcriptional regulator